MMQFTGRYVHYHCLQERLRERNVDNTKANNFIHDACKNLRNRVEYARKVLLYFIYDLAYTPQSHITSSFRNTKLESPYNTMFIILITSKVNTFKYVIEIKRMWNCRKIIYRTRMFHY